MKKYEGKVICTDVDGTFIGDDFKIPAENLVQLHNFRENGGLVTLATGRTIAGLMIYIDDIKPDLPIVCQNGGAIYDFKKGEYIWWKALDKSAEKVAMWVLERFPGVGVEVITVEDVYTVRANHATRKH